MKERIDEKIKAKRARTASAILALVAGAASVVVFFLLARAIDRMCCKEAGGSH